MAEQGRERPCIGLLEQFTAAGAALWVRLTTRQDDAHTLSEAGVRIDSFARRVAV